VCPVAIIIICAVWSCERCPEEQKILPHVGIFRFYVPKNKKDVLSWARAINCDQFKVITSTEIEIDLGSRRLEWFA